MKVVSELLFKIPGSLLYYATRILKRVLERCSELVCVFKEVSKQLHYFSVSTVVLYKKGSDKIKDRRCSLENLLK
jgi:hypothetical protein